MLFRSRSAFYLAQSHYDNGDHDQALHWYRKRVILGGWWEEIFYSKLRIGQCLESLGKGFGEVSAAYLDCFEYRPQRAEPLFELARMCREHKRHQAGYLYARAGVDIPFPENDLLFVNAAVYRWRLQDELAIHAYYTDRFAESASLLKDLLASGEAPPEHVSRLRENLRFATQKLSHAP